MVAVRVGKNGLPGGSIRSTARAPAGARAVVRPQTRAVIASNSFPVGKRPVAFFE